MCPFKHCPIFSKCEHESDQVLYCRHVEMIKKIAKMRAELRQGKNMAKNQSPQRDRFQVPKQTIFDLSEDTKLS
jgi:hypothetical protein